MAVFKSVDSTSYSFEYNIYQWDKVRMAKLREEMIAVRECIASRVMDHSLRNFIELILQSIAISPDLVFHVENTFDHIISTLHREYIELNIHGNNIRFSVETNVFSKEYGIISKNGEFFGDCKKVALLQ